MKSLYASPLRVYLCLGVLALVGIFAGTQLPVSLFPNASKPRIHVGISYGSSTAEEFMQTHGNDLESRLRNLSNDEIDIEKIETKYESGQVSYDVEFKWGTPGKEARREVENAVHAFGSRFPEDVRDSIQIWGGRSSSGFFALSFYSDKRGLDEVYKIVEPMLAPLLAKVKDADNPGLWNPMSKEIRLELIPEKVAALQIYPSDVERAVHAALGSRSGGSVMVGTRSLNIQIPRAALTIDDLGRIPVRAGTGSLVHLSDITEIDFGPRTNGSQSFKTDGAPSIILWSRPRPEGNVKRMSEDLLAAVETTMPQLPQDIKYKILVDPSEFIQNSVNNVIHEVIIGACLAVAVLFLFIGSLRNVITAAIEIPMSMVLALILMRASGMNLNLISLGGLALSAGMNVDASVVVMENIFRHFEGVKGKLDFATRLRIVTQAVSEVRFAVISSTIASLVVFLPLIFTSNLSNAILGDLAKTVVFSHGLSAIVALILVPTVRLQLMSGKKGAEPVHSPIEGTIKKLEDTYARALGRYLARPRLQLASYAAIAVTLAALFVLVLPRLPKEVIGKPDTDWIVVEVNTQGNKLLRQMESQAAEIEHDMVTRFGSMISYTFTVVNGANNGEVMARLKDKHDMKKAWKAMEAHFTNTPLIDFWVGPWNPAELPIPKPPQMQIAFRGGSMEERSTAVQEVRELMESKKVFPQLWSRPRVWHSDNVVLRPNLDQWLALEREGASVTPGQLSDLSRVATSSRWIAKMPVDGTDTEIVVRYPEGAVSSAEDLGALPVGIGSKIIPLRALMDVSIQTAPLTIQREDGKELFQLLGEKSESEEMDTGAAVKTAEGLVAEWRKTTKLPVSATFEDAEKDITDALHQLGVATALSVLLIFLTLVIQFGSFVNAALVLVAIPLGLIGVLASLFIFKSTLSLNSILGVILLNGIAVANSIILVDFITRQVNEGLAPLTAAIEAGRKRLRPILITSLTTILGMLPVALGMGEGGRILQPLGIAVSGGLWISMSLTLFVVPALQVSYLRRREKRRPVSEDLPAGASYAGAANEIAVGLTVPAGFHMPARPETSKPELLQ